MINIKFEKEELELIDRAFSLMLIHSTDTLEGRDIMTKTVNKIRKNMFYKDENIERTNDMIDNLQDTIEYLKASQELIKKMNLREEYLWNDFKKKVGEENE